MSRIPVPRFLGALAAEVASGKRAVAEPRDAATVVLLRPAAGSPLSGTAAGSPLSDTGPDEGGGFEVLLLCRGRTMDFAPGAHVFPGGSVDPRDGELDGLPAAELSEVLGVPAPRCRAIVGAAVRETFEECGVLLAAAAANDGPPDPADRAALLAGTDSLADVLGRRGLTLGADVLIPWGRWITPEVSDRRYDTWFFAAAMPEGQVADAGLGTAGQGGEADSAVWLRPAEALDRARHGDMTLLPPTAVTLAELASFGNVAEVLGQHRTIEPRMPTVLGASEPDGQVWLVMPEGVKYPL
jgi:8-oxo-dGTP pyrophosphatase MutT (NUDIX family)